MLNRRFVLAVALCAWPALARTEDVGPVPLRPGEVLRGRFVQERHLSGFASVLRTKGISCLPLGAA